MSSIARLQWQAPVRALRVALVMASAIALVIAVGPSPARADDRAAFESFAQSYRTVPPEQRAELAEEFIRAQDARSGFPIVGADSSVVFLYRAQLGETVRLLGDFAPRTFLNFYWSMQGLEMEPLAPDAPVFIRRMTFEPDAILNYAFRVNGQYRVDPLNRNQDQGGPQGEEAPIVSVVPLPQHVAPPEANVRAGIAQGQLVSVDEPWATPGITIYLPPGYSSASRYPVIYTGDGSAWNKGLCLPTILDNLIADHRIVPVIAVMIDSRADRGDWYGFNPDYIAYLTHVVAWVDEHYSTKAAPESRVHFGSSAAARAALYAAQERPDLFGKVALFSPGLAAGPHVLGPYFAGDRRFDRRLQVWMSIGTYEGGMVEDVKFFDRYLTRARIRHTTVFTHAGHTFSNWRQLERSALEYFFALDSCQKDSPMIARHWRGWTTAQNADAYEALLQEKVLPGLKKVAGYRGGYVLRRDVAGGVVGEVTGEVAGEVTSEVEFVVVNLFDSLDAVKRFAGPDYAVAVFEPEARRLLSKVEPLAAHYDVRVNTV